MDPPVGLQEAQKAAWLKDKQFLQQLMDDTKVNVSLLYSTAVISDTVSQVLYYASACTPV